MMFLRVLASVLKIFRGKLLNGCITAVTAITLFINSAIAFEESKPTLLDNPISEADLLTKQILLKGIEINRFNLLYRLEAGVAPKHRHTRYFMAQETSALGNLTAAVHIWTVCQIYSWRKKSEGGRSEPELFKPICDDDCNLRKPSVPIMSETKLGE